MCNRLFIKGDKEIYKVRRVDIYFPLWTYASNTMFCNYHSNKTLYSLYFELIKNNKKNKGGKECQVLVKDYLMKK